MSLALLFDLDDTLLKNKNEDFLPRYLKLFAGEAASIIPPDLFVRSLLTGTDAMVNNRRPDRTLRETFYDVFFPLVGIHADIFEPVAEHFYQDVFPALGSLMQPIPAAQELVKQVFERGYHTAISTNPLFPLQAIMHRLDWANLPQSNHPFDLITSYETFHFAKPNPEFFAEVLGRLGWPESAAIIGDDPERDIVPAARLGIPSYHIQHDRSEQPSFLGQRSAVGSIEHLLDWIDSLNPHQLKADLESPEKFLMIMRTTPAVLDGWARSIPAAGWASRPQQGEWSLTEIICHLRDVDQEVNLPRVTRVLQSVNPFIPGEDTDRWAEQRQYRKQDGLSALQHFIEIRLKLVQTLEALQPDEWEKPARHAIFGPTTLRELVGINAAHDRLHLQQACTWAKAAKGSMDELDSRPDQIITAE